jgi:hypothetical protein
MNNTEGSPSNLKKPWEKGTSGNPRGRPKGSKNYSVIIKEILTKDLSSKDLIEEEKELFEALVKKLKTKITRKHLLIFRQYKKALQGDTKAFESLANREEGRPVQHQINENYERTYEDYLDSLPEN